jgi:hypothetical protein
MVLSRPHRVERVTITLVPTSDERSFRHVPSTFSTSNRMYAWRNFEQINYMIVPRRIASNEIKVDMFVDPAGKGKSHGSTTQKFVQSLVRQKIENEWAGLKLGNIGKPTSAVAPEEQVRRGTIEEILGADLNG